MVGEKISVLIAAYNEEDNIARAIEGILRTLPNAEIIVADDGSVDQTVAKARQFEDRGVKVITLMHKGKGHAIQRAIEFSAGEVMVQLDADLQFPAEAIPYILKPILEGKADIVFGSRYLDPSRIEKGSTSYVRRAASHIVALVISIICHRRYTDVFTGLKAWKAKVIKDMRLEESGFSYEAEIAIKAQRFGYTVVEVPTAYKCRISGSSKIKFLLHAFEIPVRIVGIVLGINGKQGFIHKQVERK